MSVPAVAPFAFVTVRDASISHRMADLDPLIAAAQRGEPRALRGLFERYRSDVSRIAYRVLGPSADLEDVVQEAFVQIYRSLPSYRGSAKFSTWLYRVVTNVARMHVRHERVRPRLGGAPEGMLEARPDEAQRPDEQAARNTRLRALYRHLDALSEKKRTVLVLHDLEGVAAAEVAEIVDAPVLTVRTRLFYARKELYAALAADPDLADLLDELQAQGAVAPARVSVGGGSGSGGGASSDGGGGGGV
jgi:RNA polymerase sigma-70 factor (ECF subfamily)